MLSKFILRQKLELASTALEQQQKLEQIHNLASYEGKKEKNIQQCFLSSSIICMQFLTIAFLAFITKTNFLITENTSKWF